MNLEIPAKACLVGMVFYLSPSLFGSKENKELLKSWISVIIS